MTTQLTAAQITQLQASLRDRQRVLLEDLRRDAQALREDSARTRDPGADAGELSDSDHAAALSASEMARDTGELQAIEQALERIFRNEYGQCVDCAEPIGAQRLLANPIAVRCVGCQTRYERTHPGVAPHSL